jgi:hypothetical protein
MGMKMMITDDHHGRVHGLSDEDKRNVLHDDDDDATRMVMEMTVETTRMMR